jgi:hypothetical protein
MDRAAKVRLKLDCGALPLTRPAKIWGAPGDGKPCSACDELILPDEIRYEFDGNTPTVWLHIACFRFWDAELRRRESQAH